MQHKSAFTITAFYATIISEARDKYQWEVHFMAVKRFGLIIPEINSPLDRDFVEGAFAQAEKLGYDLIVYRRGACYRLSVCLW